jgi:plasmid segregation protein ParM
VTVAKAMAVAQPQGALVHYAAEHEKIETIGTEQSLVIDPGSRTFDWLVTRGMRLVQKQSHSINRGMSDVLRLLAAEISKDIGTPYRDYDAIDLALRTGKAPVIFQKPYDMKRHLPLAESVAQQAVSTMRQWIETPESLQNIILVGGGAFLFKKAVKAAFPEAPDPRGQGADVRQRAGVSARGAELRRQHHGSARDRAAGRGVMNAGPERTVPSRSGWCSSWPAPTTRGCIDELVQFPQGAEAGESAARAGL